MQYPSELCLDNTLMAKIVIQIFLNLFKLIYFTTRKNILITILTIVITVSLSHRSKFILEIILISKGNNLPCKGSILCSEIYFHFSSILYSYPIRFLIYRILESTFREQYFQSHINNRYIGSLFYRSKFVLEIIWISKRNNLR